MEITQTKLFNHFTITSLSRINRASGWISMNISFNKHFPKHFFLFMHVDIMNLKLLAWSSINIVKSFRTSSSLSCFITTANFGPAFFHYLYPKFTCIVFFCLSAFVLFDFAFSKAKLLFTLFINVEREPVINNYLSWLTIYIKFYAINSGFIEFSNEEIVSHSFSECHHFFFAWFVFSKTGKSCQEIAIG